MARPAGRPAVELADLVRERRFTATNARHRRAMLTGEIGLPPEDPRAAVLEALLAVYRRDPGDLTSAPWIARRFEEMVRRG
jgi:hypothetical protein